MDTHTAKPLRITNMSKEGAYHILNIEGQRIGLAYTIGDATLWSQAPVMLALLNDILVSVQTVPILKEPPWTASDVVSAIPMMEILDKIRNVLQKIGGERNDKPRD